MMLVIYQAVTGKDICIVYIYIYNNYTHICSYIHYIRLSGSLYHKLFHGVMTTASLESISTERVLGF